MTSSVAELVVVVVAEALTSSVVECRALSVFGNILVVEAVL